MQFLYSNRISHNSEELTCGPNINPRNNNILLVRFRNCASIYYQIPLGICTKVCVSKLLTYCGHLPIDTNLYMHLTHYDPVTQYGGEIKNWLNVGSGNQVVSDQAIYWNCLLISDILWHSPGSFHWKCSSSDMSFKVNLKLEPRLIGAEFLPRMDIEHFVIWRYLFILFVLRDDLSSLRAIKVTDCSQILH